MKAAAAFYDLEGTLVSTNLVHTLGFYARNQPSLVRSFTKSAATLLSVPLFAVSDQYSRKVFNDLFFKRYKGETEDRMRYFADELFIEVLKPAVYPGAFELIEKSRSLGLRQVVVTGALDVSVKPLMEYLGITDYVANRLEFVKGVATGRLLPPVLASATKASWIRTFAERLNKAIRGSDLAARLGGDEFLVLLPECKPEGVLQVLSRLSGLQVQCKGHLVEVSFSAGWTNFKPGESADELVRRADDALYANKRAASKRTLQIVG